MVTIAVASCAMQSNKAEALSLSEKGESWRMPP
jgi:hypothetical protein